MTHYLLRSACTAGLALCTVLPGQEQAPAERLLLGQSCALKGPARELGLALRTGLRVCLAEINAAGGVAGRRLDLISINDGYEPKRCLRSTRMLIDKERVFALIGAVGGATSLAALPLAEQAKLPFFGPLSGTAALRDVARHPGVVNLRAGYAEETEALVAHLVGERGFERIACFYQDDASGQAGREALEAALARRKLSLVGSGKYRRNTVAVLPGLRSLQATRPQAIILMATYRPAAEFIRQARKVEETAASTFCCLSSVGTMALSRELAGADRNCLVSQVVPVPWDSKLPVVRAYRKAMQAAGKGGELDFVSLEGYLLGRLLGAALTSIDGPPTAEGLLTAIRSMKRQQLGGLVLRFGPTDNQGSDRVYLTRLHQGRAQRLQASTKGTASPGK